MDSEKDEGYISPQESVEGHVQPKVIQVNSWDTSVSVRYDRRPESGFLSDSHSLENLSNSTAALITDNFWLTFPEAKRILKVEQLDDGTFEIPTIEPRVPELKRIKLPVLLSDIMDMLCGKPSSTFILEETDGTFKKNAAIVVEGLTPSVLNKICRDFLETGSTVVKLNNVDEHFHFQTVSLAETESKVWVKLIKFVKDFLKVYQTIVMLNRAEMKTLTGLRRFIYPFQQQIRTLWDIIDAHVFANPALLLKNLNDFMLQTEVPWICQLLQNLLVSCAASYTQYVADWIYRGELKSKLEFHIIKNRVPASRDRQFWTSQFAQNDEIPLFIQHLKGHIFETGRAFVLLRQLCDNKLPPCLEYNTDIFIPLETSNSKVLALMKSQEDKLSDTLAKNSYLEAGINEAMDFRSFKYESVDMEAVKAAHMELEMRAEVVRSEKIMKAREKKQTRLAEILDDMEQARTARVRRAIDDLFEDKRIEEQRLEMVASQRGAELLNRLYGVVMMDSMATSSLLTSQHSGINSEVIGAAGDGINIQVTEDTENSGDCGVTVGGGEGENGKHDNYSDSEKYYTARTEMSASATSCAGIPELPVEETSSSDPSGDTISFSYSDSDLKTKPVMPLQLKLDMFDAPLLPPVKNSEAESDGCEETDVFQTNRLLSLSVESHLMAQNKIVNLTLLHFVIVEKQLFRHLKALQDYLLLQNGLFGRFLAAGLIEKIDKKVLKGQLSGKVLAFNGILDDVLHSLVDSDEIKFLKRMRFDIIQEPPSPKQGKHDGSSSSSAPKRKQGILSDYEILNSVCLRYKVDWPLNLILTDEFLRKAESTFDLQMRLQRVEILLGKAAVKLKCKNFSPQVFELNTYRHHMFHFVRSLQSYINMIVIQPSWEELTTSLPKVNTLEEIYDHVVHYIKSLTSNILLGPKAKPIMKLLHSQLVVIEAFCSRLETLTANLDLSKGQQMKSKEYKMLVEHYLVFQEIQAVFAKATFSASQKGYYPKISHFVELFNYNGFYNNLSGT